MCKRTRLLPAAAAGPFAGVARGAAQQVRCVFPFLPPHPPWSAPARARSGALTHVWRRRAHQKDITFLLPVLHCTALPLFSSIRCRSAVVRLQGPAPGMSQTAQELGRRNAAPRHPAPLTVGGLRPRASTDPRTVRLALELLERTAGRRRRSRRCRSVLAENARKRGQAWSVCTPCAQAIEDETRQFGLAPALIRRCLVCRTDIAQLRTGARTCGDACRNVLSRLLRSLRRPVP